MVLEIRGHEPFAIGQGLLACVAVWHGPPVAVRKVEVIPENPVEPDPQRADSGPLTFNALETCDPVSRGLTVCDQRIQFDAIPGPDDPFATNRPEGPRGLAFDGLIRAHGLTISCPGPNGRLFNVDCTNNQVGNILTRVDFHHDRMNRQIGDRPGHRSRRRGTRNLGTGNQ